VLHALALDCTGLKDAESDLLNSASAADMSQASTRGDLPHKVLGFSLKSFDNDEN